ncbi:MAG: polyribonucleotide nucleotidyltransferase [Deltaproteobacteria bacterium]|nr:polyribonucleotide nucleotidyltransferase [Deltaproteobacteria bacterium]
MTIKRASIDFGGQMLTLETGHIARQADGAVLVHYGETIVIATAVSEREPKEKLDFFPLTVNYQEMTYAAGRFPGGFIKREGRPSDREILISRFIDRPIRPLFPKGYQCETQIIATVLSADQENEPDILGIIGASAALTLSDIPFNGPLAGVRVGKLNGKFVINPTHSQIENSELDIIVAGTKDAILMVEGEANMLKEEEVLDAIIFGHEAMQKIIDLQLELKEKYGKPKRIFVEPQIDPNLKEKATPLLEKVIKKLFSIPVKRERRIKKRELFNKVLEDLEVEDEDQIKDIKELYEEIERKVIRDMVINEGKRIDGRMPDEIRPISCSVGLLPRTHGSSLFTRGETQVLAVTTFGTSEDEQKIDTIEGEHYKNFMVHYNFPPYSTGEVSPLRAPSRREIGHGALAERALKKVMPSSDDFPYTVRVVSEVFESNGSSSMATVCGGSLSLMDAGVPIKKAVAGIAMGLIMEGDKSVILSDIVGDEDHAGDMDFKVAGTDEGVTALQMDIKVAGIKREIMQKALEQARKGRLYILKEMSKALAEPRKELSKHAPRIKFIQINPDKIRDIIGPFGKTIKSIIEQTGVKIDIEENGLIKLSSVDANKMDMAIAMIKKITQEAEIGQIYMGKVKKVVDFGAFVEIFPGTEGLVHISQLSDHRVRNVRDIVKEGDDILVKVIEIDEQGKIRLSRKAALKDNNKKHSQK